MHGRAITASPIHSRRPARPGGGSFTTPITSSRSNPLPVTTFAGDETDRGPRSDELDERRRSSLVGINATSTSARAHEGKLLEAARGGDDDSFRRLVEP